MNTDESRPWLVLTSPPKPPTAAPSQERLSSLRFGCLMANPAIIADIHLLIIDHGSLITAH